MKRRFCGRCVYNTASLCSLLAWKRVHQLFQSKCSQFSLPCKIPSIPTSSSALSVIVVIIISIPLHIWYFLLNNEWPILCCLSYFCTCVVLFRFVLFTFILYICFGGNNKMTKSNGR